jgi:hypothetical protein
MEDKVGEGAREPLNLDHLFPSVLTCKLLPFSFVLIAGQSRRLNCYWSDRGSQLLTWLAECNANKSSRALYSSFVCWTRPILLTRVIGALLVRNTWQLANHSPILPLSSHFFSMILKYQNIYKRGPCNWDDLRSLLVMQIRVATRRVLAMTFISSLKQAIACWICLFCHGPARRWRSPYYV